MIKHTDIQNAQEPVNKINVMLKIVRITNVQEIINKFVHKVATAPHNNVIEVFTIQNVQIKQIVQK